MGKSRFNTNFFETYAKLSLETLLGEGYSGLVNIDRPDLQMEDKRLGIEVTRAMEESKTAALSMLKEMAGMDQDIVDTDFLTTSSMSVLWSMNIGVLHNLSRES